MSHIHNEPGHHDLTVSAFIIYLDKSAPKLLLHRHKILHKWLQFGGHVELNENPWVAVIREISEESGYTIKQLKLLQPMGRLPRHLEKGGATFHPNPVSLVTHQFADTAHYHTDISYAFVTEEQPAGSIGEDESMDTKAFTLEELTAIPLGEVPENVRSIGLFALEDCLKLWEQVDTALF